MTEDAGCDEPAILNHCRGLEPVDTSGSRWRPRTVPHLRACWVLALLLDPVEMAHFAARERSGGPTGEARRKH